MLEPNSGMLQVAGPFHRLYEEHLNNMAEFNHNPSHPWDKYVRAFAFQGMITDVSLGLKWVKLRLADRSADLEVDETAAGGGGF